MHLPTSDFLVFHAQRREGEPSFTSRNIAILDSFRPHLARAGFLAARWRLQRLRAATEALALIGVPAVILDRTGRSLAANELIQSQTTYLRWLPRDGVGLVDAGANALLRRTMANLLQAEPNEVLSFVSRVGGDDAAVIHLIPIWGKARDVFDGGLALLTLTPVRAAEAPSPSLVRALFDLSGAEGHVAPRGRTIEQLAEQSGVSRETVRTQMRAVFAKTGTNRQAEVAALLAGMPRFPIG